MASLESWLTSDQFPDGSVTHRGFALLTRAGGSSRREMTSRSRRSCATPSTSLSPILTLLNSGVKRTSTNSDARHRHAWQRLAGKALDDPAVMAYLADGFGDEIAWLRSWHDSGQPLVRLERLDV